MNTNDSVTAEKKEQQRALTLLGWVDWFFVIWGLFTGTVVSRSVLAPMHQETGSLFLSATPSFPLYYGLFTIPSIAGIVLLAAGARLMMRGDPRGIRLHRTAMLISLIAPLALLAIRAWTGFTPGGRSDGEGYALLPLVPQVVTLWPLAGLLLSARITPRPRPWIVSLSILILAALGTTIVLANNYRKTHAYPLTLQRTDIIRAFTVSDDSAWRTQLSLQPETFLGTHARERLTDFAAYCRKNMNESDLDHASAATVHLAATISRMALELEKPTHATSLPMQLDEPAASLRAIGGHLAFQPLAALLMEQATAPSPHPTLPDIPDLPDARPTYIRNFETAIQLTSVTEALRQAIERDRSLLPLQRDIYRGLERYQANLTEFSQMHACMTTMATLETRKRAITGPTPKALPYYLSPEQETELETERLALPHGGQCPASGVIETGPLGAMPHCSHHGSLNQPQLHP
jgi:hypothetical protein